ncbi:MAG: PEGA domain-containing protein [Lachnospiraceae bacterium]|nr:PEGA domain-containing protein [Lachnospiraceae bacterium]
MRKNIFLMMILLLITLTACGNTGNVKVYNDTTEDILANHVEEKLTAVMISKDLENDKIVFLDYISGDQLELGYHGGVVVTDTRGSNVSINDINVGSVLDITYYADTKRLISIASNSNVQVLKNINKFAADVTNKKATYKGSSCKMSEFALAFDDGKAKNIMEVSTEDKVTLYLMNGSLISCVIDEGHGYVRLINQHTYVGGMVEIGYDVIVPVTDDMLLAVREGTYTLRINKNGYSDSKEVTVEKDKEIDVDISDIAIPRGTVSFVVTPAEAEVYVNNDLLETHAYTNIYGSYGLKIKAEGYQSFNGSFKVSEPVKSYTFELTPLDDATTEEDTTETTEETTDTSTDTQTTTESETSTETTTESVYTSETTTELSAPTEVTTQVTYDGATDNTITIKTPVGASVYVDGNYVGYVPVTFPKVVGTHTIILYQTGSLIKSYTIQAVDDGKDDEYSFDGLTALIDLMNIDN